MTKHVELFNNTWNVRISDPGEEGAQSHFFETVYLILTAHLEETIRYEFVRRVEDQVKLSVTLRICRNYLNF
ncbi:hypothetical protein HMPREF9952_2379 [Haemophilus pittmaniae HK 85]|uniref:Uncharacterized protein n=1 Tax=Haemophilus pittmaniae HK 85 TaxID=1035188 RepID=F9Q6W3_9PAST|nr:hypothetical protein HMPREF9952_2379 [Haemophilus pittmaniae HK 85]